jgi:hypothetical protein
MRIIPPHILKMIHSYDKSLDILWNQRIGRWVVVQKLPKWMPVTDKLRGCPAISGERTNFKTMFACEYEDGLPVEPGPWIVRHIIKTAPLAAEAGLIDRMEREAEEAREREFNRILEDATENTGNELKTYGGIGNYSAEGASKKHFLIEA